MNDVENYQKANQNLFHRDGVLYLIELFSKIADRLVFCMFDIKATYIYSKPGYSPNF